ADVDAQRQQGQQQPDGPRAEQQAHGALLSAAGVLIGPTQQAPRTNSLSPAPEMPRSSYKRCSTPSSVWLSKSGPAGAARSGAPRPGGGKEHPGASRCPPRPAPAPSERTTGASPPGWPLPTTPTISAVQWAWARSAVNVSQLRTSGKASGSTPPT